MKEKLIIENFAGIDHLEIELNKINIFIGPQASGKSITAKLFFYFKSFVEEIKKGVESNKTKTEIKNAYTSRLKNYFPRETTWPKKSFLLKYFIEDNWISISKQEEKRLVIKYSESFNLIMDKTKDISLYEHNKAFMSDRISSYEISHNFKKAFDELVEKHFSFLSIANQFYIPAGRSFFSNIQSNIFSMLNSNQSLDPFIVEFGSFYEDFKRIFPDNFDGEISSETEKLYEIIDSILHSSYKRKNETDYLIHKNDREVDLLHASSGQQESLPLLITLRVLNKIPFPAIIYIEEPEAHLFPDAQKNIIQLLAKVFNSKSDNYQIILTTHSPYILSSFNNLMYAGSLDEKLDKSKIKKLNRLVPKEERIDPKIVSAYSLDIGGKKKNLIDRETGLISQNYLDDVSNKISNQFGKLLDLEF